MASPAVAGTALTRITVAATSYTINLPASIASGDGLIIVVAVMAPTGTETIAATGWANITNFVTRNGTAQAIHALYRQANGSEGSTVTVTNSDSSKVATVAYRITGHQDFATSPQATTGVTGSGTNNADPPSVSVTGGPKDVLSLACMALEGEVFTGTGAPTNWTNNQVEDTGVSGSATVNGLIQVAQRQETNVSTVNPGVFSHASNNWVAQTIVIHPAGPAAVTGTIAATQAAQTGAFTGTVTPPAVTGTIASTQAADVGALSGTVANPVVGTIGGGSASIVQARVLGEITGGGSSTFPFTFASTPTSGSHLYFWVVNRYTSGAGTVTLPAGLSWIAGAPVSLTNDIFGGWAKSDSPSDGVTNSWTFTKANNPSKPAIHGYEIAGVDTATPERGEDGPDNGSSTTASTAGVSAQVGDLGLFGVVNSGGTTITAWSDSYTTGTSFDTTSTGGSRSVSYVATKGLSAVATTDPDGTLSVSGVWIAHLLVVAGGVPVFQDDNTAAFTGTVADNAVTGTIASTQDDQTGALTGTETITGTIAATQDDQTGAFTGALTISGTVAATQADDTAAFTGLVANPVTGILGATQDDDTADFQGTAVSDGAWNSTQDDQTGQFNGTVANPITGTWTSTQDDQTGAFTGTVTPPAVTATIGATQDDQTGSFTGLTAFGILGTIGAVQDDNTGTFTGTVVPPAVTGVIAAVQDDQTGSFTGLAAVGIVGTIGATQDPNVGSFTGLVANPAVGPPGTVVCTVDAPTATCVLTAPTATCVLTAASAVCTISPVNVIAGTSAVITATFRDVDGNLADPTTVEALIQHPDGTTSAPTPTSASVGVWTTVVPTDDAGFWFYQITGTGNDLDVVCVGSFCAQPSLVSV